MPSGSRAGGALPHSGVKGFLPFKSSAAEGGAVKDAGEPAMPSESGTWPFCPLLETKGLLALLIGCKERKAGREGGARVGSVALVSSSEGTLQKGIKHSHVTCGCNTRLEQTSFSTRIHQLLTLQMNYTCKRPQSQADGLHILKYAFTEPSAYGRALLLWSSHGFEAPLIAPQAVLLVRHFVCEVLKQEKH